MGLEEFATDSTNSTPDKPEVNVTEPDETSTKNDPMVEMGRRRYVDMLMIGYEYSPDGEHMGPDPPSKFEQKELPEDEWHPKWVDATGEFEDHTGSPTKSATCQNCGLSTGWTGHRARFVRCDQCGAVNIDKLWEDDRVENPNLKSGVDEWL